MRDNQLQSQTADNQTAGKDTITGGFGSMKGNSINPTTARTLNGDPDLLDPQQDLDDILAGKYDDSPADLYAAARRVLIAEFARQIVLSPEVHQQMVDIITYNAPQEEVKEQEVQDQKLPKAPRPALTQALLDKAKEKISEKQIIEYLIKNSEPGGGTSLLGDDDTRGKNLQQWRENILNNYNALIQTTAEEVFDLESTAGYNKRAVAHQDAMEASDISDAWQNFRDDKRDSRGKYKGKAWRDHKKGLRKTRKAEIQRTKDYYANEKVDQLEDASNENIIGRAPREDYIGTTAYRPAFNLTDYGKVIDPQRDFKFELDGKPYVFNFSKITIDDIMPLVTPRAKDSVIDMAADYGSAQSGYYSEFQNLDNTVGNMSIETQDAEYKKTLQYTFNGNPAQEKSRWKTNQDRLETDTLTADYTALYRFKTTLPEWRNDYNSASPKYAGYNEDGTITESGRKDLYAWLEANTPSSIEGTPAKWDNKTKTFVPGTVLKEANEYKDDGYSKDYAKTLQEKEKLRKYNALIADGSDTMPIYGWDVDTLKLILMVDISKQLINQQKWAFSVESDKLDSKHREAGDLKKTEVDKKKDKINAKDNVGTSTSFNKGIGTYKNTAEKRYGGYDETTGEYLNLPSNSRPIEENLIWMINYKIEVDNKPADH